VGKNNQTPLTPFLSSDKGGVKMPIVNIYYKNKNLEICFAGDCVKVRVPRKPGSAALDVLKQALVTIPWVRPGQWKDLVKECGGETNQMDMFDCVYHFLKRRTGIFGVSFVKSYTDKVKAPKYHYREFGKSIPVEWVVEITEAREYHGKLNKTVYVLLLLPKEYKLAREIMARLV
jgi:hypothetical protein